MLPFYKTFPFMDYYKNEDAFAKDLGMIKDMYPHDKAMIQSRGWWPMTRYLLFLIRIILFRRT